MLLVFGIICVNKISQMLNELAQLELGTFLLVLISNEP